MQHGRYTLPEAPGYSIEMRAESLAEYESRDSGHFHGNPKR
jgi:hypothetical protein